MPVIHDDSGVRRAPLVLAGISTPGLWQPPASEEKGRTLNKKLLTLGSESPGSKPRPLPAAPARRPASFWNSVGVQLTDKPTAGFYQQSPAH